MVMDELSEYTVTQLRQFLRKLRLLITGLRNELITPLSLDLSQVMNTDMISWYDN